MITITDFFSTCILSETELRAPNIPTFRIFTSQSRNLLCCEVFARYHADCEPLPTNFSWRFTYTDEDEDVRSKRLCNVT